MSRLIKAFFFFSLACTRITNQHVDQLLLCGADLPRDTAWFTVSDSRDQPLKADFEVIDLTDQRLAPIITRNGCVQKPDAGQYLIRSLIAEEARVVNAEDIEPGEELTLLDYSKDSFSVSCNEGATTVSRSFSLADVLDAKVLDNLRPAYALDYELDGIQQSFSLLDAERLQLLMNQKEE